MSINTLSDQQLFKATMVDVLHLVGGDDGAVAGTIPSIEGNGHDSMPLGFIVGATLLPATIREARWLLPDNTGFTALVHQYSLGAGGVLMVAKVASRSDRDPRLTASELWAQLLEGPSESIGNRDPRFSLQRLAEDLTLFIRA